MTFSFQTDISNLNKDMWKNLAKKLFMRAGLITPSSNPETFEIIINYLVNDNTLSIVNIDFKSMTERAKILSFEC